MSLIREYAGAEREFRLRYGEVMDLEEACGKRGILSIYRRMAAFEASAAEVFHTVRLGLVGGGMGAIDARDLVKERFDVQPLAAHVELATDILLSLMDGAPEPKDGQQKADPEKPIDIGAVFKTFAQTGIPPQEVRDMRFGDVLHLYEAAGRTAADLAPTEDEFEAMMERFNSPEMDWARAPRKKD